MSLRVSQVYDPPRQPKRVRAHKPLQQLTFITRTGNPESRILNTPPTTAVYVPSLPSPALLPQYIASSCRHLDARWQKNQPSIVHPYNPIRVHVPRPTTKFRNICVLPNIKKTPLARIFQRHSSSGVCFVATPSNGRAIDKPRIDCDHLIRRSCNDRGDI